MRARTAALGTLLLLAACGSEPTATLLPERARPARLAADAGITVLPAGSERVRTTVWGLNDAGQAVGQGDPFAFLWENGSLTSLGALGGDRMSTAWEINAGGAVVGTTVDEAFIWRPETGLVSLGRGTAEGLTDAASPLVVGGDFSGPVVWREAGGAWDKARLPVPAGVLDGWAFGVNASEVIVGAGQSATGLVGLLWRPAGAGWTVEELPLPEGARYILPNDVNDAGQASGWIQRTGRPSVAFVWEDGAVRELAPLPGGTLSSAYKINARGDVAGTSNDAARVPRAVIWRDGVAIALPMPAGAARCEGVTLNDVGQVGGACLIGGLNHPVIWELGPGLIDATATRVDELAASGDISSAGVANAAHAKLAAARAAAERGNVAAARGQLGAFVEQVQAQSGKHVSPSAAHDLGTMAGAAADYLRP